MHQLNKIILDVDTGEDDFLAIQLAVALNLPIDRIITSHGNTSIENSTENTARLLNALGATQIEVIRGSHLPLSKNPIEKKQVSAGDFVGANGICDLVLPENKAVRVKSFSNDSEFIQDMQKYLEQNGPVDYIVTGPLTNLARLCIYFGEQISQYIRNVFIMGGAFYSLGNTGPELGREKAQIAEFNIYCDPLAAYIVSGSALQKHFTTWDLTKTLTISYEQYQSLKPVNHSAQLTLDLMEKFFKSYGLNNNRQFEFNDPLTVLAATGYGEFHEEKILVELDPQIYGKTTLNECGQKILNHSLGNISPAEAVNKMLEVLGLVYK